MANENASLNSRRPAVGCPRCGSPVAENIYGDVPFDPGPDPYGSRAAEVRLRGCVVEPDAARFECLDASCGFRFGVV